MNITGMVRVDDHQTNIDAAAKVDRVTIRDRVLAFAIEAGAAGFIDSDLRAIDPDAPESSLRKRRSELTKDGIIVNTGATRENENGQSAFIWKHRDFLAGRAVFMAPAASNPITASRLDEIVALCEQRKKRALDKLERARDEVAAADTAFNEALAAKAAWDGQMVLF